MGLIALEDKPFFQVSKRIKICHCDQKPGAIAFFVETKICSAPNKVQRGRRLTSEAGQTDTNLEKQ